MEMLHLRHNWHVMIQWTCGTLGHLNKRDLIQMKNGVIGVNFTDSMAKDGCIACYKGKQSVKPFGKNGSRANGLLEIIHGDLAGPMDCATIGGCKYFLILVDDYSRRTFVYLLKHKSETFDKFCIFSKLVENQTGKKIRVFRSDNGTEFCSNKFKAYLESKGIQHQTSIPYTPQQNGLAERTIRTVCEKARCMIHDAGLHTRYWGEAVMTATYVKNHTVSSVLNFKSPMEIWTKAKPDIRHFRVFGSPAYALVSKEKRGKFDAKSKDYIFVGYCETQNGSENV